MENTGLSWWINVLSSWIKFQYSIKICIELDKCFIELDKNRIELDKCFIELDKICILEW